MMLSFAVALIGAVLVRQLPEHDKWGRYVGTCLMGANSASFPLLMSMMSGNIGGFTKKTTVNAMVTFIPAMQTRDRTRSDRQLFL